MKYSDIFQKSDDMFILKEVKIMMIFLIRSIKNKFTVLRELYKLKKCVKKLTLYKKKKWGFI